MTFRKLKKQHTCDYNKLEAREMLASVSIQDVNGRQTLVIDGDPTADSAIVQDANASQVRVNLNGQTTFHNKSAFERIRFLGRSGDDFFHNQTDIDSAAFGHAGNDNLVGGNGNNWIQGGEGNDQLTGGDRNDQIRGRAGNDIIRGGKRHDRLFGNDGNDQIFAGSGNDFIRGDAGQDILFGQNGNDRIAGGSGDDEVNAGSGDDRLDINRNYSSFTVFGSPSTLIVEDNSNAEGRDEVSGTETFRFNDVTLSAQSVLTADRQITIRPIVAANSNGTNPAEFFGNAEQETEVKLLIDEVFAQANIDIVWENERNWNNTFINIGNAGGGVRPSSDLQTMVQTGDGAGYGSPNSSVIDAYFVEIAPGFNDLGENFANGLAFIDAAGVGIHIGDTLVNSRQGREIIAQVVSHEVAHNLSLEHVNGPNNLMSEENGNTSLTQSQINQIRNSQFVLPT